ncbi:MAG: hypothetical protein U0931_04430 [Vulcanimicrobiota bacterium]
MTNWREFVEQHTLAVLQVGGADRARVRLLQWPDGSQALLKDFSRSSWLYRMTLGRLAISNEARAYQLAEGVVGVPRLLARPQPDSLVVEGVQGRSLNTIAREDHDLPFGIVDQARDILARLHGIGVAHGDLGHDADGILGRDANVIWGEGQLYLIDFASAVYRDRSPAPMFEAVCTYDRLLITKLLRRYFPERQQEPEFNLHLNLPPQQRVWLKMLKKI